MREARESLTNEAVAEAYERFREMREADIVSEVRRVCDLAEDQ